jgi:hypothetical protein
MEIHARSSRSRVLGVISGVNGNFCEIIEKNAREWLEFEI